MALIPLFWSGRTKYITVLMLLLAVVMVRLGLWQYARHHERAALNAHIAAALAQPPVSLDALLALPDAARAYRRVTLTGSYADQQILWRNREYQGATGFHILTVLSTSSGQQLLVNRGWIPYQSGSSDAWQTQFTPPSGVQTVTGVWYTESEAHDLTRETNPLKWFSIDTAAISAVMGVPLLPGTVQVQPDTNTAADVYPHPIATADMGIGSHLGYTVQWFSFAVILLGGYTLIRVKTQAKK